MSNDIAEVTTYDLKARNGRHIRVATRVIFTDGRTVDFLERVSKREARRLAVKWIAEGVA